jgi:hypothetical protein
VLDAWSGDCTGGGSGGAGGSEERPSGAPKSCVNSPPPEEGGGAATGAVARSALGALPGAGVVGALELGEVGESASPNPENALVNPLDGG